MHLRSKYTLQIFKP